MIVSAQVTGDAVLRERLQLARKTIPVTLRGALRTHGSTVRAAIQSNAAGRPGPRKLTGEYVHSWRVEKQRGWTLVATTHPAARRLEYGFIGADVLGRVYQQHPFPHVASAVATAGPIVIAAVERAVRSDLP